MTMMKKNGIKYVVFDVDGTLTDGTVNIGNNGELYKSFYCKDGLGIKMLINAGIEVMILTARESDIVISRAKELGIKHVFQGAGDNKEDYLKRILNSNNISPENLAYMGDDLNDIKCMELAGLVACPADAHSKVKECADFISQYNGGYGAVREFVEWILT